MKNVHVVVSLLAVLVGVAFVGVGQAHATAFQATDVLGQLRGGNPVFTINGVNNSPNDTGFGGPSAAVVDEIGQRLFVGDGLRILVYSLTATGTLASHTPDYVLGASDFFTPGGGSGGSDSVASTTFSQITDLAYDSISNRLFVADEGYGRVLILDVSTSTMVNYKPASYVLGQPDLNTTNGGVGLTRTSSPKGLAYDSVRQLLFVAASGDGRINVFDVSTSTVTNGEEVSYRLGNQSLSQGYTPEISTTSVNSAYGLAYDIDNNRLFVADSADGHRIMVFDTSVLSDAMPASYVIGQSDFTTSDIGTSSSTFNNPYGLAYNNNRLFASDNLSNRILVFDVTPGNMENGMPASNVLGQPDFTTGSSGTSANTLYAPKYLNYDSTNNHLLVADGTNHRILLFDASAITDGESAVDVLGHVADGLPRYDYGGAHNGPGVNGLNFPESIAIDEVSHRLFLADGNNNRVVVFNLNSNNNLLDYDADYVLGQPNMYSDSISYSSTRMSNPYDLAFDPDGNRLFVANGPGHRVLVFDVTPGNMENGMPASNVLGQPDFNTSDASATTTAKSFSPSSLEYDTVDDRLFVGDVDSNRILVFDAATSTIYDNMPASHVLGQADFTTSDPDTSSSTLEGPYGLAYDSNRLFVSDGENNRILVFDVSTSTIEDGMPASNVLGQADFDTASSVTVSSTTLSSPAGLAYSQRHKRLFVADNENNRVLGFNVAPSVIVNGEPASVVLGQPDFTSSNSGVSATNFNSPWGLAYDISNKRIYVSDESNNRVVAYDHIRIDTASLPNATVGVGYAQDIDVSNEQGTVTFALADGSLPPGMIVGSVDGTPTDLGTYTFTIQANDSVNGAGQLFDSQEYTLLVSSASAATHSGKRSQDNPPAIVWYAPTSTSPTSTTPTSSTPAVSGDSELRAQIVSLLAQISALRARLGLQPIGGDVLFTRDLTVGSTGSDVRFLQRFLNAHNFSLAEVGLGSSGNETERFGALTRNALARFQAANSIFPAGGYFGPKTRAFVNNFLGQGQ